MESLPQPKDVIDHPRPSGFPSLEPAYILKSTPGGSIETIPGFTGPHISAEVVFGGDWIYFDPDQKQTRMNVKGIAKYAASLRVWARRSSNH
ncbi:MAG: hypothetical protein LQ345_000902 [Seirophora villosa]|nr:MAG: hypothetical protein LQ345_000902 [Seirophora villosa]